MNYLQSTDKRTEEFKRYTREDNVCGGSLAKALLMHNCPTLDVTHTMLRPQFSARSIEEKVRSIERLQASLQEWKLKIVRNSTEYNEKYLHHPSCCSAGLAASNHSPSRPILPPSSLHQEPPVG